MAGSVDGGAADEMGGAGNREAELGFHGVENAERLVHDFGADAVSGKHGNAVAA
jgi:hypothetical protein